MRLETSLVLNNLQIEESFDRERKEKGYKLLTISKLKFCFLGLIVVLCNDFFYDNMIVMLTLDFLEVAALAVMMYRKRFDLFIMYYLLFLSSCMENLFSVNGSDLRYTFKGLKFLGVNLSVYVFVIFIIYYFYSNRFKVCFSRFKPLRFLQIGSITIVPIGAISGFLSWFNDVNGIKAYDGWFMGYLRWGYTYAYIAIEVFMFSQVIIGYGKLKNYKETLIIIVLCQITGKVIGRLLGNYSVWNGDIIGIVSSSAVFLFTLLILFFLYDDFTQGQRLFFLIIGTISIVVSIRYATGQEMLLIAIIPIVVLAILCSQNKYIECKIWIVVCLIICIIGIMVLSDYLAMRNPAISGEIGDVVSLFSFDNNWIENMGHSPRVRIAELANTAFQYKDNAFSLLFGRGFMGTYVDNLKILDFVVPEDYSEWERRLNIFSTVHESFAQFFLYFGLSGVVFYLGVMKDIVLNIGKSPWLLVGGIWFGLHYAFNMTAIPLGVIALVIGYVDLQLKHEGELLK